MHEGDMAKYMYDITAGSVCVYKRYGTPDEKIVDTIHDGECVGEMEMVCVRSCCATVIAAEKTEAIVIDRDTFGEYIKTRPAKVITIMQQMSDRLRKLGMDYMDLCHVANEAVNDAKAGKKKSEWYRKLDELANKELDV